MSANKLVQQGRRIKDQLFLYTGNKQSKTKIQKIIPFTKYQKEKVPTIFSVFRC